ncbi:MAG: hypothetical protein AAFX02_09925 [Pseudomonadota bacterium]
MTRSATGISTLLLLVAALFMSGCATNFGAKGVAPAGFNYNQAIAQTTNEQLLLNLVKLRYRDTPVFLEIESVTTQRTYATDASIASAFPFSGISDGSSVLSGGASYVESPTVQYAPLHGEKFASNLLAPIPPETIVLLSSSGWSLERLLLCCVERVGGLSNAPSASGPTPANFPDNRAFREAAEVFRALQSAEKLHVELIEQPRASDDDPVQFDTYLVLDDPNDPLSSRLSDILGLRKGGDRFRLVGRGSHDSNRLLTQDHGDLLIIGRSVLGALYALSHTVDAPETHKTRGLVTTSQSTAGSVSSWQAFHNDLFKVLVSKDEPDTAFVKIKYRDHWFWIDDSDLDSKATLNLLVFLVALQSADGGGAGPLLTLNAGG